MLALLIRRRREMEIRVEIIGDKVDDEDEDEAAILVRTQSRVTMTKKNIGRNSL